MNIQPNEVCCDLFHTKAYLTWVYEQNLFFFMKSTPQHCFDTVMGQLVDNTKSVHSSGFMHDEAKIGMTSEKQLNDIMCDWWIYDRV